MKTILIISFTNLDSDPRVNRQIQFLKGKYAVTAAGLGGPEIKGVDFIRLERNAEPVYRKLARALQLKLGLFDQYYRGRFSLKNNLQRLAGKEFDLVLANDIESIPLAVEAAHGARLLFDAHEYAPREFEDKLRWRVFKQEYCLYLCQTYLNKADKMITVCDSIAEEYHNNYKVTPEVITNASKFCKLLPSPVVREQLRIVHHGGAYPSRKIELMIEMMEYMDKKFSLDLILVPSDRKYYKKLKRLAAGNKCIRFIEPVQMQEIVRTINCYDIGLYLLTPNSFNNKYALPNKFFEFIQARLAVAVGPSPEMASIVTKYKCGLVAESFDPKDMANRLNSLTKEDIEFYKLQSHKAAYELSQEKNFEKFGQIISELLD